MRQRMEMTQTVRSRTPGTAEPAPLFPVLPVSPLLLRLHHDPSTQPGTPRWTHPLVSRWKQSSRVEPARNFIPAPSTIVSCGTLLPPLLLLPPCLPASLHPRLLQGRNRRLLGGRSFSSDINNSRASAFRCAASSAASISRSVPTADPSLSNSHHSQITASTRQWLQGRNRRNSLKTKDGRKFYPSITRAVSVPPITNHCSPITVSRCTNE